MLVCCGDDKSFLVLVLPGSRRRSCLRFVVADQNVGWILPQMAAILKNFPDVFDTPTHGAISLSSTLDTYGKRSEGVDSVLQILRRNDALTCLKGWRDEVRYDMLLTGTHMQSSGHSYGGIQHNLMSESSLNAPPPRGMTSWPDTATPP